MTKRLPYQDPNLPAERRLDDLIGRMTIEEKVGQLCQLDGRRDPERMLEEQHPGSFLFILGEDAVRLQRLAEKTRLGIPLLFGMDAIHGHALWPGATVLPTQLAMSCSWDPEMVREAGRITAREAAVTGAHWTFSPVCDIARDTRWGRVDETFGEDPYLAGELAAAIVRGYQGDDPRDPDHILACAKHYAGYCETQGGRDASEADLTRRKMLSYLLPPHRAAVRAGCATVMTAYQAIDGVPCTLSRWLLTEVLREQWGFDGFVVTDWDNVGRLQWQQHICRTLEEASAGAVQAGNDMMMSTPGFYQAALNAVRAGGLSEAVVEQAARRILRIKFERGLFDANRYPDLRKAPVVLRCAEHRALALECACRSLVLLKNERAMLPLNAQALKRIAVIGPNADDVAAQLGDWALGGRGDHGQGAHPRANTTTVLDGIRRRAPKGCRVEYARGCSVSDPHDEGLGEAVALALQSDLAVLVLGDDVSLNGENRDRAVLEWTGLQNQLLQAVLATGTPVVLVIISGKPLCVGWSIETVPAVLAAWNPGCAGGEAVAAVLFGDRSPEGRLSITWPAHVGQLPVYYNQLPGWHAERYADLSARPLFPFGFGLTYTTFSFTDLRLASQTLRPGQALEAAVDVTNAGRRDGTAVVQLYVRDLYGSVTTPVKELKAFARVALKAGEKRTVRLQVPCERLALIDAELREVVEPGEFEVMVGASSRDEDLLKLPGGVRAETDRIRRREDRRQSGLACRAELRPPGV
jgi:beta-glucosidase